jgi:hypothetical protein
MSLWRTSSLRILMTTLLLIPEMDATNWMGTTSWLRLPNSSCDWRGDVHAHADDRYKRQWGQGRQMCDNRAGLLTWLSHPKARCSKCTHDITSAGRIDRAGFEETPHTAVNTRISSFD